MNGNFEGLGKCGLKPMLNVQRGLSVSQAVPVVGPIFVSPIKFGVSAVQFGVGLPVTIVAGAASGICFGKCNAINNFALYSLGHAGMGGGSMAYSVANILSLGILGYKLEKALS